MPGGKSCAKLANDLELNPDALERLLDACVGLKLLNYHGGLYENTDVATAYLWSESPLRLTGYINSSNEVFWKLWEHLEEAIREGSHRWKAAFNLDGCYWDSLFKTPHDKEEFLIGMHGFGQITSPKLVRAFNLNDYETLVDLGGGTGHFAIAACEYYPNLSAKVFEVAKALPLAKRTIDASPVRDRIEVIEGDFFEDDLPKADLYCLARILHDWPADRILALLRRISERMKPEGALLIAEKLLSEDRSGPSWAQMQNLNMLVITEGKERTFAQYRALLSEVGFDRVRAAVTDSPLDCILAEKLGGKKPKAGTGTIRGADQATPDRPWVKRPAFPIEAEMYSTFFERTNVGFVIADLDGKFLLVNKAFADIIDLTVPETLQRNYKTLTPSDYAEEDAEQIRILMDRKSFGPFQKQYYRGKERPDRPDLPRPRVSVLVTLQIIRISGEEHIWASVVEAKDQVEISPTGGRVVEFIGDDT